MRLKRAIIVGVATACALAVGGVTMANASTRPSTVTVTGVRAEFVGSSGESLPEYWAEVTISVRRGKAVRVSSTTSICLPSGCVFGSSMWDNAALDLDAQANGALLEMPARDMADQLSYSAVYASELTQGEFFDAAFLAMYTKSLRSAIVRGHVRR